MRSRSPGACHTRPTPKGMASNEATRAVGEPGGSSIVEPPAPPVLLVLPPPAPPVPVVASDVVLVLVLVVEPDVEGLSESLQAYRARQVSAVKQVSERCTKASAFRSSAFRTNDAKGGRDEKGSVPYRVWRARTTSRDGGPLNHKLFWCGAWRAGPGVSNWATGTSARPQGALGARPYARNCLCFSLRSPLDGQSGDT